MNNQTLLLRQVHPNFFTQGQISSQAFLPSPKDEGKLSVYDRDKISPMESYQHYTKDLRLKSVGVWATSGEEVKGSGLIYSPDPVDGNEAHAIIDFGSLEKNDCRKLAKKLKQFAIDRGNLYHTKDLPL